MMKKLAAILFAIILFQSCILPVNSFAESGSEGAVWNYYYSQLDSQEKAVYNKIYDGILHHEDGVSIPEIKDNNSKRRVIRAIRNDHPELFPYLYNVDPLINYYELPTLGMDYVITNNASTYNENNRKESELKKATEEFLSDAPRDGTDYEKELFVHDKMIRTITTSDNAYNIYDTLVNHIGNSIAYALTMKYLLSKLGVKSYVIEGKTARSSFNSYSKYSYHMWNIVSLNGKNYPVDVQRDDLLDQKPEVSSTRKYKKVPDYITHRYFNFIGDDAKDYIPYRTDDWAACQENNAPVNYYQKNGLYFSTYDECKPYLRKIIENNLSANCNNKLDTLH